MSEKTHWKQTIREVSKANNQRGIRQPEGYQTIRGEADNQRRCRQSEGKQTIIGKATGRTVSNTGGKPRKTQQ